MAVNMDPVFVVFEMRNGMFALAPEACPSGVFWHGTRLVPSPLPVTDWCWILRLCFAPRWMTSGGEAVFGFGACRASFGTAQGWCRLHFPSPTGAGSCDFASLRAGGRQVGGYARARRLGTGWWEGQIIFPPILSRPRLLHLTVTPIVPFHRLPVGAEEVVGGALFVEA